MHYFFRIAGINIYLLSLICFMVLPVVYFLATTQAFANGSALLESHVFFEGHRRRYYVHVPHNYDPRRPMPLVLAFHGGGDDGRGMARLTGFDDIADESGFLTVYPDGMGGHWSDGRKVSWFHQYNDVGFVDRLVSVLEQKWNIDKSRVYAVGFSDGGFFAQYLALRLPGRFAGVASVAATLPEILVSKERPKAPLPVMYIAGMEDPVVPFHGGEIGVRSGKKKAKPGKSYGLAVSAARAVEFWLRANRCPGSFQTADLPDVDETDGTRVKVVSYTGCPAGADVVLYGIEGGGHTWPAHRPARRAGKGRTSRDIEASREIWNFFKRAR